MLITYAGMGSLLLAYVVLLVANRDAGQSTLIRGWGVGLVELFAGFLCIAAGRRRTNARAVVPVFLGVSLVTSSLGDVIWTIEC